MSCSRSARARRTSSGDAITGATRLGSVSKRSSGDFPGDRSGDLHGDRVGVSVGGGSTDSLAWPFTATSAVGRAPSGESRSSFRRVTGTFLTIAPITACPHQISRIHLVAALHKSMVGGLRIERQGIVASSLQLPGVVWRACNRIANRGHDVAHKTARRFQSDLGRPSAVGPKKSDISSTRLMHARVSSEWQILFYGCNAP